MIRWATTTCNSTHTRHLSGMYRSFTTMMQRLHVACHCNLHSLCTVPSGAHRPYCACAGVACRPWLQTKMTPSHMLCGQTQSLSNSTSQASGQCVCHTEQRQFPGNALLACHKPCGCNVAWQTMLSSTRSKVHAAAGAAAAASPQDVPKILLGKQAVRLSHGRQHKAVYLRPVVMAGLSPSTKC